MKEFLSRILEKQITELVILNNELPIGNVLEKKKSVDVLAKVDGKYVHIELNATDPTYLHHRNFIYFSNIFSTKTKRGEDYDLKTKFYHIDFSYGMGKKKEEETRYYVMSKGGKKYVENIEIIEYNMDKIMNYWYNLDEEKVKQYKHLIMLDLDEKGLQDLSKGDELVMEYEKKVVGLNEEETFQSAMSYEEDQKLILNTEKKMALEQGIEQGIKQGIEQGKEEGIREGEKAGIKKGMQKGIKEGIQKGIKEGIRELTKNLLKDNIPVEKIQEYTGLSEEEIKKLKDE